VNVSQPTIDRQVETSAELARAIDAAIDPELLAAVASLDGRAPLLAGMARYHLGFAGPDLVPIDPRTVDRGKRIRPAVAMLAAGACGGDPFVAAPLGAAIELLHNFTLIHDDIQDDSPTRRHRPTVWRLWGIEQAINAGDALFAVAHLPFAALRANGASADLVLRLLDAFDRMTIAIVEGQTLDLGFETRSDVSPAEYLEMIAAKTSAIVCYAARAGALLGGATDESAARWAEFGLALGLGFQIRDDLLGIWGAPHETGKAPADDIRRRKQSLPILLLRERLGSVERAELARIYDAPGVDGAGVARVLDLLAREGVRAAVEVEIALHHDRAREALLAAAPMGANPYRDELMALVERLSTRSG
jgi:geranylgeranyl diphosphate synthase, type I